MRSRCCQEGSGLGAHVIVCEVDPLRALEAVMDGCEVMPSVEAAREGDLLITVTGDKHVLDGQHFGEMKDGAIIANSGHFNVEINIPALEEITDEKREARPLVEEYRTKEGRRIYLLADGRLVNLSCAEGHPSSVMDMSFANQAFASKYIVENHDKLEKKVYDMPKEIDEEIARLKLETLGIDIDNLTDEQEKYLSSWDEGT